ncbi:MULTISPECIES: ester cyclase [unclassified Methanoculleus]|uniref:ester cyclase n=1 Tax=unclassified Methanoculleus TaxID=2619537 RepID=UPI0025DA4DD6|nr:MULTISPECIES: ester cyclase [unclassified Methanoculleus]
MSVEENKAIVRRFIEAYNSRNLDLFDELVAPDYVDHTHHQQGRESFKQLFTLAFDAFPDWHERIGDIIAEGDRVWVCVKATGTHTGEWNLSGVPLSPTGKKVAMTMVFMWRMVNGKLAEGWEVDEDRGFLKQLGAIEYTEKGKKLFPEDAG